MLEDGVLLAAALVLYEDIRDLPVVAAQCL
jgi:hypothetical protein